MKIVIGIDSFCYFTNQTFRSKVKSFLINQQQPFADSPKPTPRNHEWFRSLCRGLGMGLIVHHWDVLEQVCWAKAAPVPAAFVLAQDSANSRWHIHQKQGGGRGSHSSTLVIYMLLRNAGWFKGSLSPPPGGLGSSQNATGSVPSPRLLA